MVVVKTAMVATVLSAAGQREGGRWSWDLMAVFDRVVLRNNIKQTPAKIL